jgi:pimeloyl-ACP methyl ester carboxylesterase
MPTVDMLVGRNFVMPMPGDDDVSAASARLPKRQRDLIAALADNAAIAQRVERSNQNAIEDLRDEIDATRNYGPVATLFDSELEKALIAATAGDSGKAESAVSDYVALQNTPSSKENLSAFVTAHTSGEARTRLLDLIGSMSDAELAGSFAIIQRDAEKSEIGFFENLYLFNYACQEDIPFNTLEGYHKITASQKYPYIGDLYDPMAEMVFGICDSFTPQQRDNWQVPVVSDIPTLSIGSLYDTQTPASWSRMAVEKLSNAQLFMIPESGHGALLYQPCVSDMGVAFVNNPQRKLSDACPRSITITWHIPDWAKEAK